jgi:hypothetical protein
MALTAEAHDALRIWLREEGFVLAKTWRRRTSHSWASTEVYRSLRGTGPRATVEIPPSTPP